jgi:hypothetical protein
MGKRYEEKERRGTDTAAGGVDGSRSA